MEQFDEDLAVGLDVAEQDDEVISTQLNKAIEKLELQLPKASTTLHVERLVFGKFENGGNILKIVRVRWLIDDFLNVPKKQKSYKFEFGAGLKQSLLQAGMLWISDYETGVLYVQNDVKSDIPSSWLNQRDETFQDSGYKIASKVILPVIDRDPQGNEFLWGAAFLESRKPNLQNPLKSEFKRYYLYTMGIAELLVKIDALLGEVSRLRGGQEKPTMALAEKSLADKSISIVSLFLGCCFLIAGITLSAWIFGVFGASLLALSAIHFVAS